MTWDSAISEINKIISKSTPAGYTTTTNTTTTYKEIMSTKTNVTNPFSADLTSMNVSDFIKYFYDAEQELASQKNTSQSENENNDNDNENSSKSGLPTLVRYGAYVINTSNKSMDEVVSAFKKYYPNRSDEKISNALIQKYGTNQTSTSKQQKNLNLSA